jgi:hypothetical protein
MGRETMRDVRENEKKYIINFNNTLVGTSPNGTPSPLRGRVGERVYIEYGRSKKVSGRC